MLKNKKGNILFELGDGVANLIIFVMVLLVSIAFLTGFSNIFSSSGFVTTAAKTFTSGALNTILTTFNIVLPMLYLIFIYLSCIFVKNSEESKIMSFIYFLLLISYVGTVLMLPANITEYLSNSSSLISSSLTSMPIFNYMLMNSLFFGLLYFGIVGIALITRDKP